MRSLLGVLNIFGSLLTWFALYFALPIVTALFGLGTGLAILIDATLVRGILVPAFMRVLGERSWYAPPLLRRLHNRIGLDDSSTPPITITLPAEQMATSS